MAGCLNDGTGVTIGCDDGSLCTENDTCQGDAAGTCQVIVGIGLNVAMPDGAARDIDQAWTDIETIGTGSRPGRNELLAALLNDLKKLGEKVDPFLVPLERLIRMTQKPERRT